jgi:hypothetical protein
MVCRTFRRAGGTKNAHYFLCHDHIIPDSMPTVPTAKSTILQLFVSGEIFGHFQRLLVNTDDFL